MSSPLVLNTQKLLQDKNRIFQELQHFRQKPTQMAQYLSQRIKRYKSYEGVQYLLSKRHRKKAIQVHQKQPSKNRIGELVGFILGQKSQSGPMQKLRSVTMLDQIAFKLCQTIYPNMKQALVFKPNTSQFLRQLLDNDPSCIYPSPVSCLVSLGFDQPYQDLINLLIDDGVLSRANRKQLFNPNLRYVGISSINTEKQPELRCTVYVLTEKILPKQGNQIPLQKYSTPSSNNVNQNIMNENNTNHRQNSFPIHNNPPQTNFNISPPAPNMTFDNPPLNLQYAGQTPFIKGSTAAESYIIKDMINTNNFQNSQQLTPN